MYDYLVSVMQKSEHFDDYVKSEIELKNVEAELAELEGDSQQNTESD